MAAAALVERWQAAHGFCHISFSLQSLCANYWTPEKSSRASVYQTVHSLSSFLKSSRKQKASKRGNSLVKGNREKKQKTTNWLISFVGWMKCVKCNIRCVCVCVCVCDSVWGWAECYRDIYLYTYIYINITKTLSILRNHRAGCHGNAAGSSSSSHQWASAICYRGKPGLLPRRPEAVCSRMESWESQLGSYYWWNAVQRHRRAVFTGVWGQRWSADRNLLRYTNVGKL